MWWNNFRDWLEAVWFKHPVYSTLTVLASFLLGAIIF